ncbi:hypothetical protein AMBR_NBBOBCOC_02831 [Lacticaseibacillus rhamnosus]|nr:hypothetical protein AMBR_NBBOBCOC_02831 [Lacticaseibacillus rhamnosus]
MGDVRIRRVEVVGGVLVGGLELLPISCFFQAEDGIRDSSTSRGLGDGYKRQLSRLFRQLFIQIGNGGLIAFHSGFVGFLLIAFSL